MFGHEIDLVGERSPIPTAAVRILRPWNRVVVFTGEVVEDWSAEDTLLALEIGARLRSDRDVSMLVFTPDQEIVTAKALRNVSVIVVAGPHRLSVNGTSVQRSLHGVVDSTDPTTDAL
jgi:hypothetical protein